MKLNKAIEIFTIELNAYPHKGADDWYNAVRLGIEALKEIHRERIGEIPFIGERLPGETED